MAQVKFKRGNKQFIDNLPIVDGQLIYNTETGETFEDVGKKRIPTGVKVDAELSKTSENPVQNKVVEKAISELSAKKADSLSGGKAVFFGDSLFGMYLGDTAAVTYSAAITKMTSYNVGFSGCRMAKHSISQYDPFSMYSLAKAISSGNWDVQDSALPDAPHDFTDQLAMLKSVDFSTVNYIVVHYGTNDFGSGVALDNDLNKFDETTACGALRYSIKTIQEAYPSIKIYVSVPCYRVWVSNGIPTFAEDYKNWRGYRLIDMCNALAFAASEYNVPVIDSYHGLNINRANWNSFLEDGTHHNAAGRKRFGEYLGRKILSDAEEAFVLEKPAPVESIFELIETISVGAGEQVSRTAEPDGTPYKFEKIKLKISGCETPFNVEVRSIMAGSEKLKRVGYAYFQCDKNRGYCDICCYKEGGFWETRAGIPSNTPSFYPGSMFTGYRDSVTHPVSSYPSINGFALLGAAITEGTVIKIYAIREKK